MYRETKDSLQKLVVEWHIYVFSSIPGQTVTNEWLKKVPMVLKLRIHKEIINEQIRISDDNVN